MLAIAVGPNLTKYMHELLDHMFACGLSQPLRQALVDLAAHIPPLLPSIQERLLNVLSLILCEQNYVAPGAPTRHVSPLATVGKEVGPLVEIRDPSVTILALQTLGTFDFRGHSLHEIIRDCAVLYLEDPSVEIRREASLTCSQLLARDPACYQSSNNALKIVLQVLTRILSIGIADPDPATRIAVLSSLDERFDHHLSQGENVRSLFIALNDEVFEIRIISMNIIGRLIIHNPAFIMPALRKLLIKLLTELEYAGLRYLNDYIVFKRKSLHYCLAT